jgi:hypothetical protein
MNSVQLSGTIAGRPHLMDDGAAIRFYLRAGHSPVIPGLPPGIVQGPCRLFDVSPAHRKILPGGKHRNIRVEAAGRLEKIVSDGGSRWDDGCSNRQHNRTLEIILNRQGLLLQRGR